MWGRGRGGRFKVPAFGHRATGGLWCLGTLQGTRSSCRAKGCYIWVKKVRTDELVLSVSVWVMWMCWTVLKHVFIQQKGINGALTWRRGLNFGRLVLFVVCKNLRRGVLTTLDFTLKGIQTLDVLFLQRAGGTAGCTHIQGSSQITPLLIFIHLRDKRHFYQTNCSKGQQLIEFVFAHLILLTCVIPPNPFTDMYSRKRSRGLRPTAGRFVRPMAFSSMKAK